MSQSIESRIISHVTSPGYQPKRPRKLAADLNLQEEQHYHAFRDALRELMHQGRIIYGARGAIVLPTEKSSHDQFLGTYRHNKRGFGFVVPSDPSSHEDLFIPEGSNNGAITGDIVRAKIVSRGQRDGKAYHSGKIVEVVQRTQKRFVGSVTKMHGQWFVMPDGNTITDPVLTPDAASRHIKPGTKVVVELTAYPENGQQAEGVITEVLGAAGEKDVDLKSVIVQFNMPEDFPDAVKDQARASVDDFDPDEERRHRLDLSDQVICTIDPDDAKDYDDAISLRRLENGQWQLGVHIADVSHFVPQGTPLDEEAKSRGNSAYFPGYVIPMLPEILSNGVCSLQEGVPRLCKSAFITYDENAKPISTKFANTIIKSATRLRYREAQAILDGAEVIPHPDGDRKVSDYKPEVVKLLHEMNALARRLQKRRHHQGQIVLDLPEVDLVLDEEGRVIDAVPEDQSFTHTLIEMFMVEANEAVARLLDSQNVPFLRRTHPEPDLEDAERLRQFVQVAGHQIPKKLDRKALQALLAKLRGKPESFAINLAVLKSLTRAEYSPQPIGHYALASEHYSHFTSPIRRYADLTIHRLLDAYFAARGDHAGPPRKTKIDPEDVPDHAELMELGKHLSFTERRADDAERELRQIKILELMKNHIGEDFAGVVTGVTNFGVFVQLQRYLNDGLVRYEDLFDDWWDVDDRSGVITGQRTGIKIRIGDVVTARIVKVDVARRELDLAIVKLQSGATPQPGKSKKPRPGDRGRKEKHARGGAARRHGKPSKRRRR